MKKHRNTSNILQSFKKQKTTFKHFLKMVNLLSRVMPQSGYFYSNQKVTLCMEAKK